MRASEQLLCLGLVLACGGSACTGGAMNSPEPAGGAGDAAGGLVPPADALGPSDGAVAQPDASRDGSTSGSSSMGRSAGCGKPAPPGTATLSVDVVTAGVTSARSSLVFVPSGYDANVTHRLVFGFHGAGGSGASFRSQAGTDLERQAAGDAVFIYPNALMNGNRTAWLEANLAKDRQAFDALFQKALDSYCIDPSKVYAVGFSSGAGMSEDVGCRRADLVRGIAGSEGWGAAQPPCVRPVAAILYHSNPGPGYAAWDPWGKSSEEERRVLNGCSTTTRPAPVSGCSAFDGCTAPFTSCVQNPPSGTEHKWPTWFGKAAWDFLLAAP